MVDGTPTGSSPLVVIDMQNGFLNPKSEHILPAVTSLMDNWRKRSWPIFLTQFYNLPGSKWETLIGWQRLRNSPETDLHETIKVYAEYATVIRKENSYTSITGPLREAIENEDWREVILCGVATESCVLATAVNIFELAKSNARPVVVRDACASHAGTTAHEAGILVLERFIGRKQVVLSNELI